MPADLRAVGGRGALTADRIGGDARVENLEADLLLVQVEGDLYVRNQRVAARACSGGDVHAELSLPPGSHSRMERSGDLICRLPLDSSVSVSYRAAGDARVALPQRDRVTGASGEAHIGAGEAALELLSGGDLRLEVIGRASAGLTEEWRQDLEARTSKPRSKRR